VKIFVDGDEHILDEFNIAIFGFDDFWTLVTSGILP
jgi:hypothetical protein